MDVHIQQQLAQCTLWELMQILIYLIRCCKSHLVDITTVSNEFKKAFPIIHHTALLYPLPNFPKPAYISIRSYQYQASIPYLDTLEDHVISYFKGETPMVLSHDRPSSLSIADPAPSSWILMQNLERTVLQPKTQSFKNLPMSRKGVGSSQQKEDMIRIRQPSSSQIVQKLVTRFVALYTPLSQLLLDLKSSLHGTAHINRIIDSYAASTAIKYLSALIAFYQTCLDLRMDINSMTSVMLADIIVASSLTRRSDGCGPSHSVLIKAIRWGHKQFNIAPLAPSFDDLIISFIVLKSHMTDVNSCLTACTSFPSLKEESCRAQPQMGRLWYSVHFCFFCGHKSYGNFFNSMIPPHRWSWRMSCPQKGLPKLAHQNHCPNRAPSRVASQNKLWNLLKN